LVTHWLKCSHFLAQVFLRSKAKNEKFKTHKLILTESYFSLIQDENEDIHKWSAFTHIEIKENYLTLTGTSQYFFPKKSMLNEDYDYFVQEIKSRMKTVL
jgi:hypothetical protein